MRVAQSMFPWPNRFRVLIVSICVYWVAKRQVHHSCIISVCFELSKVDGPQFVCDIVYLYLESIHLYVILCSPLVLFERIVCRSLQNIVNFAVWCLCLCLNLHWFFEGLISCFFDQVSKEFDGVVKQIRDSVQLLVLPPDLSPAALQGFVCASFLSRAYVSRIYMCL